MRAQPRGNGERAHFGGICCRAARRARRRRCQTHKQTKGEGCQRRHVPATRHMKAGWAVHAQGQTRQAWTAHSASALTFILVDVPSMQL